MQLDQVYQQGLESTRYLERYVNNVKGKHEDYSETSSAYSPHEGIEQFPVPVFSLSPDVVSILQAEPDPRLLREILGADVKFIIHPEMLNDPEYLERVGLDNIQPDSSTYFVTPTSSTRTLLTIGLDYNFMVKTDLEKKHYKFIRRLKGSSIDHSIRMSLELGKVGASGLIPEFSYLPESLGIILGDKDTGAGVLFREIFPRPLIPEDRVLVPYFSLYADDLREPNHIPILVQLVRKHAAQGEELDYFVNSIAGKIVRNWGELAMKFGILPELHGQNTLLELDSNLMPQRIVYRDFQATYVDADIRQNNGLDMPFEKHIAGSEAGTDRGLQYSHIYDQNVGDLLLARLVNTFIRFYPQYSFETVADEIKKVFHASFPLAKEIFPEATYKVGPVVNNEVQMVMSHETPIFR
jgi:hypothetical protein